MTVAIPSWQHRISPVLDTAMRLLVVTCRDGRETRRREVLLEPRSPEAFAQSVSDLRVDVLLCAALSQELLLALERRRVRVWPHLCGEVDAILRAFGCGELDHAKFHMPGCRCPGCHRLGGKPGRIQCRRRPGKKARALDPFSLKNKT